MTHTHHAPPHHPGFGPDRAAHYDAQAAVSLPGVHAMYELVASALTSALDDRDAAHLLLVGLGTGAELQPFYNKQFDVPGWQFTGVEPSDAMLSVARARLEAEGLLARTHLHLGELHTLPAGPPFDGAQMLGVLHHVPTPGARHELLREVSRRLAPGAPLVVGCRIGDDPTLTSIELRRLRTHGITAEMIDRRRQALATLRPIESDTALFAMLASAGLVDPHQIFASLLFKVFVVRNDPTAASAP